jgi:hypothetical protein
MLKIHEAPYSPGGSEGGRVHLSVKFGDRCVILQALVIPHRNVDNLPEPLRRTQQMCSALTFPVMVGKVGETFQKVGDSGNVSEVLPRIDELAVGFFGLLKITVFTSQMG